MLLVHNIPHFEYLVHHNCIQVYVKLLVTEGEKRLTSLCFKELFFFFFWWNFFLKVSTFFLKRVQHVLKVMNQLPVVPALLSPQMSNSSYWLQDKQLSIMPSHFSQDKKKSTFLVNIRWFFFHTFTVATKLYRSWKYKHWVDSLKLLVGHF